MVASGDPINATDVTTLEDYTIRRPIVRLIQQVAQSVASNTDTAVTFGAGSEDIDTHGYHDTAVNTSRITPLLAGYYQLQGVVSWAGDTDIIRHDAVFAKNGSVVAPRNRFVTDSTATAASARMTYPVVAILTANGSTDYFELICNQLQAVAGALNTVVAGSSTSIFECLYLRPL
jgi:hypothetical protein